MFFKKSSWSHVSIQTMYKLHVCHHMLCFDLPRVLVNYRGCRWLGHCDKNEQSRNLVVDIQSESRQNVIDYFKAALFSRCLPAREQFTGILFHLSQQYFHVNIVPETWLDETAAVVRKSVHILRGIARDEITRSCEVTNSSNWSRLQFIFFLLSLAGS